MSNKYINNQAILSKLEEEEEKKKEKQSQTPQPKTATFNRESSPLKEKSASEIVYDLNQISRDYGKGDYIDAPESLNLEKKDIPDKTNEELESLAKSSLEKKYGDKKDSTNVSFEQKISDMIASKDKMKDNATYQQEEISSIYDKGIKETENQMLRRGLARSSIVIGEISNLEGSKANELAKVLQNLEENLTKTEANISSLEKQKEDALSSLDIEYALELEQEIDKVKNDYNKAKSEAIEFNNNIDKLEAEYKLKLDKQKTEKQKELAIMQEKYGKNYTSMLVQDKQFEYLKEYLSALEPSYAMNLLLTNKDFKTILGSRYGEMYQYLSLKQ